MKAKRQVFVFRPSAVGLRHFVHEKEEDRLNLDFKSDDNNPPLVHKNCKTILRIMVDKQHYYAGEKINIFMKVDNSKGNSEV